MTIICAVLVVCILSVPIFWLLRGRLKGGVTALSLGPSHEGGGVKGIRALVVTAHPDDECMFFAPTILALTAECACQPFLLCLSEGRCTLHCVPTYFPFLLLPSLPPLAFPSSPPSPLPPTSPPPPPPLPPTSHPPPSPPHPLVSSSSSSASSSSSSFSSSSPFSSPPTFQVTTMARVTSVGKS